jgi:hypothetical protein
MLQPQSPQHILSCVRMGQGFSILSFISWPEAPEDQPVSPTRGLGRIAVGMVNLDMNLTAAEYKYVCRNTSVHVRPEVKILCLPFSHCCCRCSCVWELCGRLSCRTARVEIRGHCCEAGSLTPFLGTDLRLSCPLCFPSKPNFLRCSSSQNLELTKSDSRPACPLSSRGPLVSVSLLARRTGLCLSAWHFSWVLGTCKQPSQPAFRLFHVKEVSFSLKVLRDFCLIELFFPPVLVIPSPGSCACKISSVLSPALSWVLVTFFTLYFVNVSYQMAQAGLELTL